MFDNFREGVRRTIKVGRERVAASEKLRKTAMCITSNNFAFCIYGLLMILSVNRNYLFK
jgi:hypothetical protein